MSNLPPTTSPVADDAPAVRAGIVVLGIGNTLRTDEGVGVHAIDRLRERHQLAEHVRVVDGGVLGLDLLPHLEDCDSLLVVDAIDGGHPPGTVMAMEGSSIPAELVNKLSMHQAGLADLLALLDLRGHRPRRLALFGVQPASLEWGLELSETLQPRLDGLVDAMADRLRAWQGLA